MDYKHIIVSSGQGRDNHPQFPNTANALSKGMIRELIDGLHTTGDDPAVEAIVIKATGSTSARGTTSRDGRGGNGRLQVHLRAVHRMMTLSRRSPNP